MSRYDIRLVCGMISDDRKKRVILQEASRKNAEENGADEFVSTAAIEIHEQSILSVLANKIEIFDIY